MSAKTWTSIRLASVVLAIATAEWKTDSLVEGISSLSIKISSSKKSHDLKRIQVKQEAPKELNIILSPYGLYDFNYADAIERRENRNSEEDSDLNNSIVGALYKKASLLSKNHPPEYPYLARRMGYAGRVTLEIQVLTTGNTGDVRIIESSGFAILDNSAQKAVRRWRFFDEGEFHLPKPVLITRGLDFIIRNRR